MMKYSQVVIWLIISVVVLHCAGYGVSVTNRLSFKFKLQDLELPQYVTVKVSCNNDCDTACCYCVIEKQQPVCVQCCQEEP
ncbi:hypothetical protein RND81_02G242800 [Saponaria officinalis]|uniref:Uncharacterized protein n=1 Tax=Saponaria officinalis TaxID=3572 RepID=A0AAW1MX59_SAPOF